MSLITQNDPSGAGETMEKILQSTNEMVASVGVASVSMKQIAERAGVSKALLHYHFKSREELLLSSLQYLSYRIASEVRNEIRSCEPSIDLAFQAAKVLYEKLILNDMRVNFITQMYSIAIHNEKLGAVVQSYLEQESSLIIGVLEDALGSYQNQLPVSIERLAGLVQTAIMGLSMETVVLKDKKQIDLRFKDLLQLLEAALQSQSAVYH